jgi:hypothetical protein
MFRNGEEMRKRLLEVVDKFRQNGATSPEKAMTPQELGLPPRFEQAMHRRLGNLGIFVEVNGGRYYLSEERLRQLQKQRRASGGAGGAGNVRETMVALRIARLITTFLVVVLLFVNIFIQSWTIRLLSLGFIVVWLILMAVYIYYSYRARKQFSPQNQTHLNPF